MKKSTWLPCMLLAYLAVMAWIGRGELDRGNWLYYFGIVAATLVCIFFLRRHLLKSGR